MVSIGKSFLNNQYFPKRNSKKNIFSKGNLKKYDISSVVIFSSYILELNYIINMIKMDTEDGQSYPISQISKDSQLISLFNQCESNEDIPQLKQEVIELADLIPETNFNFRGYWSDGDTSSQKNKLIKKQRQIINKKEKFKTKKRTKLYIEMLESRVNELRNQNEKLRKLNKINKEYIHRLNQSQHHINGYFVGRQQVFEQLEQLSSAERPNNAKIIDELISLRMRQGSYGRDRIKAINYYFTQMIEMLLPEIQKYLVKIAIDRSQFFDETYLATGRHRNQLEGWRKTLYDSIEEEDSQSGNIKKFLKQNHTKMMEESDKFKQMLENFNEMKCNLIEQAKKIEEVLDHSHSQISPAIIAKTLCYIAKYRFQKDISLEHIFNSVFEEIEKQNFNYVPNDPYLHLRPQAPQY